MANQKCTCANLKRLRDLDQLSSYANLSVSQILKDLSGPNIPAYVYQAMYHGL